MLKIIFSLLATLLLGACGRLPELLQQTDRIEITYINLPLQRNSFVLTDPRQISVLLELLKDIKSTHPMPITPRGGCSFSGEMKFITKGQTTLTARFTGNSARDTPAQLCRRIIFRLDESLYDGDLNHEASMLLDGIHQTLQKTQMQKAPED